MKAVVPKLVHSYVLFFLQERSLAGKCVVGLGYDCFFGKGAFECHIIQILSCVCGVVQDI
jgi:hypothetical protein